MELSICYFSLLSFFLVVTYCLALKSPLCHKEERSALLQFKQSFSLNLCNSSKLASWKIEGPNSNCCSWEGVECNYDTSYVIGLDLSNACLHGTIDSNNSLFQLVHLRNLNLSYNNFNHSKIPKAIGNLFELKYLDLSSSQFFGQVPFTISMLHNLLVLDLSWNVDINSRKPLLNLRNPNLRNLISNFTNLEELYLSKVDISSFVPSFLSNFSSLKSLYMGDCGLHGNFPEKIFQLQKLERIVLMDNPNLYGHLPNEFNSSSSLKWLWLSNTRFYGKIPFSIGNLLSLTSLFIAECNFFGPIPSSIGNLTELRVFVIAVNKFSGEIPSSLGNLAKLDLLCVSVNQFNVTTTSLSWLGRLYKLRFLGLSLINLSGNFLSSFQNLTSLVDLNMKNNYIMGKLPHWLGNFSNSLIVLSLSNNMFSGSIPNSFGNGNSLKFIDLSNNQLQGQIPRTFSSCKMLEAIVLRNNQLHDVFPSWLRILPNLQVLVLGFNQFYGAIGEPRIKNEFSKLHIIDLSNNNFSGNLPSKYMNNWNAMKSFSSYSTYINTNSSPIVETKVATFVYFYSISIISKGFQRDFEKIQEDFSMIDLSCNRFEGEIPYLMGNLQGLQSLNLSYNKLIGQIPSSLGNMQQLEVLDLSHNKLFGNIPQQLSKLTFLEIFNVSYNNFSGPLPHGTQLNNLDNNSYVGNPSLCGEPLSKKCDDQDYSEAKEIPFQTFEEEDKVSIFKFFWEIVLIGYGCGGAFGIFLGNYAFTHNQAWFLKTFGVVTPNGKLRRRMKHRNRR